MGILIRSVCQIFRPTCLENLYNSMGMQVNRCVHFHSPITGLFRSKKRCISDSFFNIFIIHLSTKKYFFVPNEYTVSRSSKMHPSFHPHAKTGCACTLKCTVVGQKLWKGNCYLNLQALSAMLDSWSTGRYIIITLSCRDIRTSSNNLRLQQWIKNLTLLKVL